MLSYDLPRCAPPPQAADSLLLGVVAQLLECQKELSRAKEDVAKAEAARPRRESTRALSPAPLANVAVVPIDDEARALLPGILMVPALPRSEQTAGSVAAGTAPKSPRLPPAGLPSITIPTSTERPGAASTSLGGADDGAEWPMPSIYLHSPLHTSQPHVFR